VLPNLIVIGAAKCGTTSMHRYLDTHPEISMSGVKELNFFVTEERWSRGLAWYESQFPEPSKVRGEASTLYTSYPHHVGIPARMAAVVPDAKLIYLVRDPMERIISSYRFRRWITGSEERSVHEAVRDLGDLYVAGSCYAMQLEQYLEHFPLHRILVIDLADLRDRRNDTLRRTFRFLAVDESVPVTLEEHFNAAEGLRANVAGRAAIRLLEAAVGPQRAVRLRSRAPDVLTRPLRQRARVPEVELDPVLRAELVAYLKPDTDRLRALTGQAFPDWCT
jgi:hypothetical protein